MNIQSNMHHDVTIQRNLKKGLYNPYRIMKVDTILTIYHLSHGCQFVEGKSGVPGENHRSAKSH
jgi:hypothetical protein